jgi:8-oxo-dGTP pyrophosphatase MutT (NUDIX family)
VTLDEVRRALELPRPGRTAQLLMSPRPRPGDVFPLPPEINPKPASVLILLFANGSKQGLHFFLTRRTELVETHKGQISLPGGMQEPWERPWQTALREAGEELHMDTAGIEVFREPLTPLYIPVSGFRVTPYVGFSATRPVVDAAPDEVVEVIETPLDAIVDAEYLHEEEWTVRGLQATVPFYRVNGYQVWGATAMILSEFGRC